MQNRPRARKKFVSAGSSSHSTTHSSGPSRGFGGGGGGIIKIILILILILGGGGGALSGELGSLLGMTGSGDIGNLMSQAGGTQGSWLMESNSGKLNTRVSAGARDKYTDIKSLGNNEITIMEYMCGTDLESRAGMATADINEMLAANISDNVNLIIYTGGANNWRNRTISNRTNQIWQIRNGTIKCLEKNAGNGAMTDPDTLTSFIRWTSDRFPADRKELILWDHGGGSASGYGYDEKYARSGSMTLENIDRALKRADVKFDFVGFDACLMATTETALMLDRHADYLIASEETEPGIGWYYTNWLSELSDNTSMPTIEIGKNIADDFTRECASRCKGQQTTLSVTDISELSQTLPEKLRRFSNASSQMIKEGNYSTVAQARSSCHEFARSSSIDQIDFAHFTAMMGTDEGKALAQTLISAVKYNRTSENISNAYGLSIFFPGKKLNKIDSVAKTYEQIGMENEYTNCIKRFAQIQVSGQAVSGGTGSPIESLFGSSNHSQNFTSGAAQSIIGSLLSGGRSIDKANISGLDSSNTDFMKEDLLDKDEIISCVTENRIKESDLKWQRNEDGQKVISLPEEKWQQVSSADMNLFYDNGKQIIDFGLDNVFSFDDDGNLLPEDDNTWIALNGQPVTYHHDETIEKGDDRYQITGHVPVLLNGKRADLILAFDDENEKGSIAGVRYKYDDSVTETAAKADNKLASGDVITLLYNYYAKDGKYKENVPMGSRIKITDPSAIDISNVDLGNGKTKITYKFTDIFGQEYWTRQL